jgi:WD40 repeat protein
MKPKEVRRSLLIFIGCLGLGLNPFPRLASAGLTRATPIGFSLCDLLLTGPHIAEPERLAVVYRLLLQGPGRALLDLTELEWMLESGGLFKPSSPARSEANALIEALGRLEALVLSSTDPNRAQALIREVLREQIRERHESTRDEREARNEALRTSSVILKIDQKISSSDSHLIPDQIHKVAEYFLISPDEKWVLLQGPEGSTFYLHDLHNGDQVKVFDVQFGQPPNSGSADFSPDESLLALGDEMGGIRVFDLLSQKIIADLPGRKKSSVNSLRFTPDSQRILHGNDDGETIDWAFRESAEAKPLASSFRWIEGFLPDGKSYVFYQPDGTEFHRPDGKAGLAWQGNESLDISASDGRAAFLAMDPSLQWSFHLWNEDNVRVKLLMARRVRLGPHPTFEDPVILDERIGPSKWLITRMAFSRDRPLVAAHYYWVDRDGPVIKAWDLSSSSSPALTLEGVPDEHDFFSALEFSPDGKYLVAAGRKFYVWETSTGKLILKKEKSPITTKLQFSRDGTKLYGIDGKSYHSGFVVLDFWDLLGGG